jgi:hypothetical protein
MGNISQYRKGIEMNQSEIFSLIIRIVGLLLILSGINHIYNAFMELVGMIIRFNFNLSSLAAILNVVITILIGIWFLKGAPKLVAFSYPSKQIKE